jgi:hypothetical protein
VNQRWPLKVNRAPSTAHLLSGSASWVSAVYPLAGWAELITNIRCAAPVPAEK